MDKNILALAIKLDAGTVLVITELTISINSFISLRYYSFIVFISCSYHCVFLFLVLRLISALRYVLF